MTSEENITRNLEEKGWRRQFVASEPRLSEAVGVYKELGFQVHLEPLPALEKVPDGKAQDTAKGCLACFNGVESQYNIIFTKPAECHGQSCSD